MPTFKITIAYDGTGLVGWQRQANGVSIQGLLEDAFAELDGRAVAVAGAGRTDAGVHALGQVATVTIERSLDRHSLVSAINVRLPESIRLLDAVEMPDGFHARFDARQKSYRYRLWNAEIMNPVERLYAWHVPAPALNVDAMAAAARMLEGLHDFAAFQGAGSDTQTTIRTIVHSSVARTTNHLITYDVTGDGFLRYMVRNIVGTLVEIGRGRRPAEWMADVLASRDRGQAGQKAPAQGLFLVGVEYGQPVPP